MLTGAQPSVGKHVMALVEGLVRDADAVERIIEQIDSDQMLLFASDYPHWQFEGDDLIAVSRTSWSRRCSRCN